MVTNSTRSWRQRREQRTRRLLKAWILTASLSIGACLWALSRT
jgi:hypothetical protein